MGKYGSDDDNGIEIPMPAEACVLIFTENDLMTIGDDHFEIKLVAQLLNQINIVPTPPPRYDLCDEQAGGAAAQVTQTTSTGATPSAPPFSFTPQ